MSQTNSLSSCENLNKSSNSESTNKNVEADNFSKRLTSKLKLLKSKPSKKVKKIIVIEENLDRRKNKIEKEELKNISKVNTNKLLPKKKELNNSSISKVSKNKLLPEKEELKDISISKVNKNKLQLEKEELKDISICKVSKNKLLQRSEKIKTHSLKKKDLKSKISKIDSSSAISKKISQQIKKNVVHIKDSNKTLPKKNFIKKKKVSEYQLNLPFPVQITKVNIPYHKAKYDNKDESICLKKRKHLNPQNANKEHTNKIAVLNKPIPKLTKSCQSKDESKFSYKKVSNLSKNTNENFNISNRLESSYSEDNELRLSSNNENLTNKYYRQISMCSDRSNSDMEVDDIKENSGSQNEDFLDIFSSLSKSEISTEFYLVIDTNILIGNKEFLVNIKDKVYNNTTFKLVIPYTILQELDNLKCKSDMDIKSKAQDAIKWINLLLISNNSSVIGQSFESHCEATALLSNENGDDAILACCLFYRKLGNNVILLSNDINLRNKCLVSGIKVFSCEQFKQILLSPMKNETSLLCTSNKDLDENDKKKLDHNMQYETDINYSKYLTDVENLEQSYLDEESIITSALGKVLEHAMIDAYDESLWKKIIIHLPPWTLLQILECFEKHWIAIFLDKLPKEFLTIIKELITIFLKEAHTSVDTKNVKNYFIRLLNLIKVEPYQSFIRHSKNVLIKKQQSHSSMILPSISGLQNEKITHLNFETIEKEDLIKHSIIKFGENASAIIDYIAINKKQHWDVDAVKGIDIECLKKTLVSFWKTFKSLANSSKLTEDESLSEQIRAYWRLANQAPPVLGYSDNDVNTMALMSEGKTFFSTCASDIERLINTIDTS